MPYINEAVQALYEGIASVEDIDVAMKLGTNVPMGPLTLADYWIGYLFGDYGA